MTSGHLTESQFLEVLYGATPEPDHLQACVACRERYGRMRVVRRRFVAAQPEIADNFFAAQRSAVRSRLRGNAASGWGRLVPAAAALLIVAAFFVDFGRRPTPGPYAPADDSEVFQEVFELVSDPAPLAVDPIRTLFEEAQ